MNELIKRALHIRFVKLAFILVFQENVELPVNKASAIRGGIGEMLLRANCIRDRNCEACDFREVCIVQRTMYTRFKEKPSYVTTGESVGYVSECENNQKYFGRGDSLKFTLLLFGENIVYFNQYLQAVCALGQQGIGRDNARFKVYAVKNTENEEIMVGNRIYMEKYRIGYLDEYVEKQMKEKRYLQPHKIIFSTPLTLKYQGKFHSEFHMDAILAGIRRRIYMLDCFEGIQEEAWMQWKLPEVKISEQKACLRRVDRYSARKGERMSLYGLTGEICLQEVPEEAKILLLAGELIHVGKNTSFGFGKYLLY